MGQRFSAVGERHRTFIEQQRALIAKRREAGETLEDMPDLPDGFDNNLALAFTDFCHALLNSNEFVYLD